MPHRSEADELRLRIALASMRMASENTYLVDKKTVFGPKIAELETLFREIVIEGGEKVDIFSQGMAEGTSFLPAADDQKSGWGFSSIYGTVHERPAIRGIPKQ